MSLSRYRLVLTWGCINDDEQNRDSRDYVGPEKQHDIAAGLVNGLNIVAQSVQDLSPADVKDKKGHTGADKLAMLTRECCRKSYMDACWSVTSRTSALLGRRRDRHHGRRCHCGRNEFTHRILAPRTLRNSLS